MKTRNLLSIFLIFFFNFSYSQNLVPNGSFEDTLDCPDNLFQIDKATGWSSYRQSPDYFNACATVTFPVSVRVPSNQWGYQYPRTGNAYAGFVSRQTIVTNLREYLGIQLSQPLIIGQQYFASFYLSRALSPTPHINVATNKIGMRLSTMPFSSSNWEPVDNVAQVYTDSLITDTLNWIQISGSFIADSAYEYLSIGNFFQDSLTSYIRYDSISTVSYYYVDDVCVSTDSLECDVRLGVSNLELDAMELIFYPSPASTQLFIESSGTAIEQVNIYHTTGSLVLAAIGSSVVHGQLSIAHLPSGVYIADIKTKEGSVRKRWVKM